MDADKPLCHAFAPQIPVHASAAYREFWRLWSESKYFECHEVLETEWRRTRGSQKLFYNGLIHCAVALYQHQRGNAIGAARQLLRAQIKLELLRPKYFDVDLDAFLRLVEIEVAPSVERVSESERAGWPQLEASIRARVEREMNRSVFDV